MRIFEGVVPPARVRSFPRTGAAVGSSELATLAEKNMFPITLKSRSSWSKVNGPLKIDPHGVNFLGTPPNRRLNVDPRPHKKLWM